MTRITEHLEDLQKRIDEAAAEAGRDSGDIRILAVSKKHGPEKVREAAAAGIMRFGENYVQEAIQKMALSGSGLEWHFIGTIQSNKARQIAEHFDWVQTVSSTRIAERLNRQRPRQAADLQVCIQVQLDAGGTHGGVPNDEVASLAEVIAGQPRLRLRGLMGMPMPSKNEEEQRRSFRHLHALMDELKSRGHTIDTLSMGMSGDLETAILEGSTMLRIGTALFGPRTA